MSRNGPIGHAGIKLPMRGHPAEDPYTAPPTGQPQWPPQQGQHHPEQRPQYAEPAPQQQQAPPGYYFPQATAEPDPNYGYAQQPPAPAQPLPFNRFPPPPAQDYAPPQQHAQAAQSWGQQPDPRGYDLGSYMPAPNQGYAPAEPGTYQQAPDPAHFQPAHDPRMGAPHQAYAETDADFDEMLAEDEEEPRRGRRGLMIVAALVGAIGLGGALAYTYKTLVAPGGGRAPLIKATDYGPNKVKADGTDGKAFAHTDKKLLNRLGDDGSQPRTTAAPASEPEPQEERASDDPNAPRKVRIIPIPPSGPSAAPMAPSGPPARAANAPMVTVPGLMIENAGPPQMPPSAARVQIPQQPPPAARAAPQLPPARAVPQAPPMVASIAPPASSQLPPTQSAAPARKAPVAAAPALPSKKPVPKTKEAAAAAPTVTGTSGYVAVLASKGSRMDALKAFADLQQKYGDVLATKTPDVQEANLGDKGLWYRAVVGPPGSRDAASAVCAQLKTAGHAGCWVTAY